MLHSVCHWGLINIFCKSELLQSVLNMWSFDGMRFQEFRRHRCNVQISIPQRAGWHGRKLIIWTREIPVLINSRSSQEPVTISWLKEQNRITSYNRGSSHGNSSNKKIYCAMNILICDLIYTILPAPTLISIQSFTCGFLKKKIGYVIENSLFFEKKAKGKVISHDLKRINTAWNSNVQF